MVLATLDVGLHIRIYLLGYARNFNIPFSNLEYRFFLFSRIVSFGYDGFYMSIHPTQGDQYQGTGFHCCDLHFSILWAADCIKALPGLQ